MQQFLLGIWTWLYLNSTESQDSKRTWIYDTSMDTFEETGNFNMKRIEHSCASIPNTDTVGCIGGYRLDFYEIDWLTWLISQAETIINLERPFGKTEQIHRMTTIFTQKNNFFHPGTFWVKILWFFFLVLPKGQTTVIIVSAWLRTQIWVKWVSQFYGKSGHSG